MKAIKKFAVLAAVLGIGCSAVCLPAATAEAAVTVESNQYKSEILYTKSEVDGFAGVALSTSTVNSVYTNLCKQSTWTKAGYSSAEARVIALDFSRNASKASSLLKKLASNTSLYLKIVVSKQKDLSAGFDVTSYNAPSPDPGSGGGTTQTDGTVQDIEVKIEYKKGDVEFSYKLNANGTLKKAKYENEMNGTKLEGSAAQKKIEQVLKALDLKKMSKKEIAQVIVTTLKLDTGYKEFELKAAFSNGSKLDFGL